MSVAVVIPSYRDKDSMLETVAGLLALDLPLHIVIVDDDSSRHTADAARDLAATIQRVTVVPHDGPRTRRDALLTGLEWCQARQFDSVCTIDGEWSSSPLTPSALIAAAIAAPERHGQPEEYVTES